MKEHALPLQPDLGIAAVQALHSELLHLLDTRDCVVLQAGDVQRVHAAGLQLIHGFIRERARRGFQTLISPVSPVLQDAAAHLALASRLGIGMPATTLPGDPA